MRPLRLLVSLLGAIAVVAAILVMGLASYRGEEQRPVDDLALFEVEYLTAEEAARLLGEQDPGLRAPRQPLPPPPAEPN